MRAAFVSTLIAPRGGGRGACGRSWVDLAPGTVKPDERWAGGVGEFWVSGGVGAERGILALEIGEWYST